MISQMNLVQNAARLAMDHRAADPKRRPFNHRRGYGIAEAAVAIVLAGAAVLLFASMA